MTPAEMRERVEQMAQRAREEMAGASEFDYLDALLARQHAILAGVANALRGDPGPLASHSHHDLAERAAALVALLAVTQSSLEAASSGRRVTVVDEVERLQRERDAALAVVAGLREEISDTADTLHRLSLAQQRLASQSNNDARAMGDAYLRAAQIVATIGDPAPVRMEPMTDGALDAACAAEDRATADDPLLDATDGAHPAWWRGHDRAAEMLTAQRDAAVARAEAAEREAARLRGFLPPVALVVCPSCGGVVTADLDDDAEYITRLHHRGVTRDGLSLVRCDGGIARESAQ